MGSHSSPNRRRFLTSGGALAAFVMGAIRSVRGQTAAPPPYEPQGLLAYGQPSKFAGHIVRRTPARPSAINDTSLMTPGDSGHPQACSPQPGHPPSPTLR